MNNKYEDNEKYTGLKKMLAILAAAGLWGVSMYFSYKGFEFESTQILWFGIVMALVITVVELVFNTKIRKLNPTLLTAGVICYIYGVYTNITGFYFLQHGTLDGFFTATNWLIPTFAGIISEVLPEALFAWGVGAGSSGDFIGNIGEMLDKKENTQNRNDRKENYFENYGNGRSFSDKDNYKKVGSYNKQQDYSDNNVDSFLKANMIPKSQNTLRDRVTNNQKHGN